MVWLDKQHMGVQSKGLPQVFGHSCLQRTYGLAALEVEHFVYLYPHFQFIQLIALPIDDDLIVTGQTWTGEQDLFDLGGEDIDAAHDEHIVGAALHALHADEGSSTRTCFMRQ